jgi:glutathione peroxidase
MTPQYAGLRTLHESNEARGFSVLGFPCNQFGKQEPGTNAEILEFVTSKFGVAFPMFAKIDVKGPSAAPLYQWLVSQQPDVDGNADIKWNFTKFLVDRQGNVVKRYAPKVTPEEIAPDVARYL